MKNRVPSGIFLHFRLSAVFSRYVFSLLSLLQLFIDEVIEISVHDAVHIAHFGIRPVILDHRVRLEHVRTDLITPGDLSVIASQLVDALLVLPLFQFDELRHQHLHGNFPVLVL